MIVTVLKSRGRTLVPMLGLLLCAALLALPRAVQAQGQPETTQAPRAVAHEGGEAALVLPDLSTVSFGGVNGRTLLMGGLAVCALGLLFGLLTFTQLKNLPVHISMREVSELIYETCKTYLITQGKFILLLWAFIAVIISAYYGWLNPVPGKSIAVTLPIILIFSLIGIAGSTGVALITFILLAVHGEAVQVQLLVWIFVMRIMMVIASGLSYFINEAMAKARYGNVDKMNFEAPLTSLVWLTSVVSVAITYVVSYLLIPNLGDGTLWWKLSTVITCGTLAGAIIPEFVKIFTSTESAHVREVVSASREGGASLNILAGFVAGNFSAYWLGLSIATLMGIAYAVASWGPSLGTLMTAAPVFAFGLVAFGFLGMGPVTIAVDSYGPVTDNAQSVFELS